jgi:hypothetical protein
LTPIATRGQNNNRIMTMHKSVESS